ncbi:MAG: helix-turn-helix domain-containing protein [Sphingobium sp.]
MPDPSNPTSRVMDVLNFLTAHPMESFTLAEIARHIGLSNGSAHRILTTMASAQFLSRNEKHRTYSLGVAMVAIGQAAIEKHRGIDIARREIARLAVELNVQCSVSAVVDEDMLILVKEGVALSHHGLTRVGERRPLVPPVGLCHMAWAEEAAVETYLQRADGHLSAAMRAHLSDTFALIRRRGYAIAATGPNSERVRQAMVIGNDKVRDAAYWSRTFEIVGQLTQQEVQLLSLQDAVGAGISYISAPVFSAAGAVSLQLVISGLPRDLGIREIEAYAERLCGTAAVITSESHGRRP